MDEYKVIHQNPNDEFPKELFYFSEEVSTVSTNGLINYGGRKRKKKVDEKFFEEPLEIARVAVPEKMRQKDGSEEGETMRI